MEKWMRRVFALYFMPNKLFLKRVVLAGQSEHESGDPRLYVSDFSLQANPSSPSPPLIYSTKASRTYHIPDDEPTGEELKLLHAIIWILDNL